MRSLSQPPGAGSRPAMILALSIAILATTPVRAGGPASGLSPLEDPDDWIVLTDGLDASNWRQPTGTWFIAGDAGLHPENPRLLAGSAGEGVLINGATGRTSNLITTEEFGDVEFRCEFLVPSGSNAGVKFQAVYEVQIFDSYGKAKPTASDCGGIYHRAELFPRYHHIDEGFAPLLNASLPPGTWQRLEIVFRSPRFDENGKKIANARMVHVTLNGQVVQDDVELAAPTGNNWTMREVASGPILLQADHGPVAFRDVRVRRLDSATE